MLLFVPFSTVAHAESDYDLSTLYWHVALADGNFNYIGDATEVRTLTHPWIQRAVEKGYSFPLYLMFEYTSSPDGFNTTTSQIIINEGDGFSVALDDLQDVIRYYDSSGNIVNTRTRKKFDPVITVQLFDINGNATTITPTRVESALQGSNNTRISYTVEVDSVPIDVYRFRILCYEGTNPFNTGSMGSASTWKREWTFDTYSGHTVKNIPEEKGLLKSIIAWLESIKNGITELFNSIAELPGKLWALIENGLKSLFVPDEQYITNYSSKWDDLLSLRFGAIYQVGGYLIDLGNEMLTTLKDNNNENYSIEFPVANIPIGNGQYFSFGGWNVSLKVSELSALYDAIKFISAVGVTLVFLNGLRKRYDEVMGVEQ